MEKKYQFLPSVTVTLLRLIIIARGESQPIDTNRTESGRARNRRVEFMRIE